MLLRNLQRHFIKISFIALIFFGSVLAFNFSFSYAFENSQPIQDGKYVISSNSSYCRVVDVVGGSRSSGTPIDMYQHNKTAAQTFNFKLLNDGYYIITNAKSGMALDVVGGHSDNGARVQQYTLNYSKAQKWKLVAHGDGYYIQSALGNFVLDVCNCNDANGNSLDIYKPNGTAAQIWHFTPENEVIKFADTPLEDLQCYISPNNARYTAMDVSNGSTTPGANIQIYTGNRSGAQTFLIKHDNQGYYTITNYKSGKVLDVAGGTINNCTNVQQYNSNNTLAQKWVIVSNSNGSYTIHSALKRNYVIDVYGGYTSNGTNVNMYTSNSSAAQQWRVYDPTEQGLPGPRLIKDGWYNIEDKQTGYVIDVPDASKSVDTNLQIYNKNNSIAQAFYFEWCSGESESGWYKIKLGCNDNLCVAIKYGSCLPGSLVISESSGGDETLWAIKDDGQKRYFINKAGNLCLSALPPIKSGCSVIGDLEGLSRNWSVTPATLFSEGYCKLSCKGNRNYVFDVPDGSKSDNLKIQIYEANGSSQQKWQSVKCAENIYAFRNIASGLWLSVNDGYVCQKKVADEKQLDSSVQWQVGLCKASYTFTNVSTGFVAELNGGVPKNRALIKAASYTGQSSQCWNASFGYLLDNGIYNILTKQNGKALDVANGSFSNCANIQSYKSNSSAAQSFRIINNSDGTVFIRNVKSKKVVDVTYGSAVQGRYIQQYDLNYSNAQRWIPKITSDGCIRFVSAANKNLCLDCGQTQDGTIVYLADYSKDQNSTKFTLQNSDYPEINWSAACPFMPQNPELPWGCESVALTELLHGMGYGISKTLIADRYMPYSTSDFVYHYAGWPYNPPSGIGSTMPPCIANTCNYFLSDFGENRFRAHVATGTDLNSLIERANCGYPSVVWTTIGMDTNIVKWGQVIDGYQVWNNLHAVCLCGYDSASDQVLVCDSLAGKVYRPRSTFDYIYNATGRNAVTVE